MLRSVVLLVSSALPLSCLPGSSSPYDVDEGDTPSSASAEDADVDEKEGSAVAARLAAPAGGAVTQTEKEDPDPLETPLTKQELQVLYNEAIPYLESRIWGSFPHEQLTYSCANPGENLGEGAEDAAGINSNGDIRYLHEICLGIVEFWNNRANIDEVTPRMLRGVTVGLHEMVHSVRAEAGHHALEEGITHEIATHMAPAAIRLFSPSTTLPRDWKNLAGLVSLHIEDDFSSMEMMNDSPTLGDTESVIAFTLVATAAGFAEDSEGPCESGHGTYLSKLLQFKMEVPMKEWTQHFTNEIDKYSYCEEKELIASALESPDFTAEKVLWSIQTGCMDREPDVTVYGTSWCGWCEETKKWLRESRIKFRYIDVEKQGVEILDEVTLNNGEIASGYPVVEINGNFFEGYPVGSYDHLFKTPPDQPLARTVQFSWFDDREDNVGRVTILAHEDADHKEFNRVTLEEVVPGETYHYLLPMSAHLDLELPEGLTVHKKDCDNDVCTVIVGEAE